MSDNIYLKIDKIRLLKTIKFGVFMLYVVVIHPVKSIRDAEGVRRHTVVNNNVLQTAGGVTSYRIEERYSILLTRIFHAVMCKKRRGST
jgi:hypothetical protein